MLPWRQHLAVLLLCGLASLPAAAGDYLAETGPSSLRFQPPPPPQPRARPPLITVAPPPPMQFAHEPLVLEKDASASLWDAVITRSASRPPSEPSAPLISSEMLIQMFRWALPTPRKNTANVIVPFHFAPPRSIPLPPSRATYTSE